MLFGIRNRDRLFAPLSDHPAFMAGIWGSFFATVIGALSNDSGPVIFALGSSACCSPRATSGGNPRPAAKPLARACGRAKRRPHPRAPCPARLPTGGLVYDATVRIALVSPYSYTYPGGVGWHVEALAEELIRHGHDVRLLAPFDPDDRLASVGHRGARPQPREMPDYLIPLGRTVGIPANGAVSNVAVTPSSISKLSRELRHGNYDVVHVHEPNGITASWFATESARTPLVATFHTYSTNITNRIASGPIGMRRLYNKLHVRIAVSEAARWTAQRFNGGRYRVIPNGVDLSAAPTGPRPESDELRLLFVGRAEERKGLPVLLRAFEALQGVGVRARLTVAGATPEEVEPYLLDVRGVEVLGRVSEEEKWRLLHDSDLLCAPSLGGESFGMVLTEAFAAGTPVVASDIAGYRDVARDGVDGVLVPPGDPAALGVALHDLAIDPERRARMGEAARERAQRFAWPNVATEVMAAYDDAIRIAAEEQPQGVVQRVARRVGLADADGGPAGRPTRLPSPEPSLPGDGRRRVWKQVRRGAVVGGAIGGVGLAALALHRIGIESIGNALLGAQTFWVVFALALMCSSMLLRAESWHAILRAALPGVQVRRRWVTRGVMIGVLMSATLPARLGEPSRALIVARRIGRVRERLPVVLGTIVSQTLLNIVALVILGSIMFATVGLFQGHERARGGHDPADRAARDRALDARPAAPRQAVAVRAGAAGGGQGARGDGAGAARPPGVPAAEARRVGGVHADHGVGDPVVRLLRAARGAGARPPGPASAPPRPCCSP